MNELMAYLASGMIDLKPTRMSGFALYLTLISLLGLSLMGWSLWQIPTYWTQLPFLLFIAFAALAAILTTSMPTPQGSGITYHVGSAVGIATVPIFGASAAIIVVAVQGICTWLIKPADAQTWKKSWRQLSFNIGMDVLAILAAALILDQLKAQFAPYPFWEAIVPWFGAAVVYSEVNLWLLIGVLRLQEGPTLRPLAIWQEDRWATQIDVILMAVGGALLSFAAQHYDWLGLVMFFLPIGLSAYAFRLYASQMQSHLDNLDQIVNERTASLQAAMAQLQVEIAERQRVATELHRLATYDALTGILNRRAFLADAQAQVQAATASAAPICVLMFDLDRFKQVNDRYGHAAGDSTLTYFAQLCKKVVPESNLFGRLGGEEFALLLPNTELTEAIAIGERTRIHCPETTLTNGDATFTVTVSIGVAQRTTADQPLEQLLERADQQLYRAKRQGGNLVCAATHGDPIE